MKNKVIYKEYANGYRYKKEYDTRGNLTYYEDSTGLKEKREYNSNGNLTYFENSRGYWERFKHDTNDNQTHYLIYENSKGDKITELSMDEIAEKFGVSVELLKIKKQLIC